MSARTPRRSAEALASYERRIARTLFVVSLLDEIPMVEELVLLGHVEALPDLVAEWQWSRTMERVLWSLSAKATRQSGYPSSRIRST